MDKVDEYENLQFKQVLFDLYELGFVSFETNKTLMEKYQSIDKVVDMLLSGALNESAIDALYGQEKEE